MTETFRQSVRPYLSTGVTMAKIFGAMFAALILFMMWEDLTAGLVMKAAGLVGLIAAGFVGAMTLLGYVISYIWTVKVDAHGIASTTFIGWPMRAAWNEIEAAKLEYISGIPYYVLELRERWLDLYVPADLRETHRFEKLVFQYIGDDHPLADWLFTLDDDDAAL